MKTKDIRKRMTPDEKKFLIATHLGGFKPLNPDWPTDEPTEEQDRLDEIADNKRLKELRAEQGKLITQIASLTKLIEDLNRKGIR